MHPYLSQALAEEHMTDARKRAASARRAKEAIAARASLATTASSANADTTKTTGRRSARPVRVRWLARGA